MQGIVSMFFSGVARRAKINGIVDVLGF